MASTTQMIANINQLINASHTNRRHMPQPTESNYVNAKRLLDKLPQPLVFLKDFATSLDTIENIDDRHYAVVWLVSMMRNIFTKTPSDDVFWPIPLNWEHEVDLNVLLTKFVQPS